MEYRKVQAVEVVVLVELVRDRLAMLKRRRQVKPESQTLDLVGPKEATQRSRLSDRAAASVPGQRNAEGLRNGEITLYVARAEKECVPDSNPHASNCRSSVSIVV